MNPHLNHNINKDLAALTQKAPQGVIRAIQKASAKTGVNFAYMVQQASAESGFNPAAKAKTSSASGLYQFIESTWLKMVDRYGEKHGLETEGKSRAQILSLRNDPQIAADMAAEFASENERFLNTHWDGKVGSTELYFAHFMGAGGAAAFLNARDENPLQEAALLFPKAAAANRNVFYDRKDGRAKTLEEVYAFFDRKFSIEDGKAAPELPQDTQIAEAPKDHTPHLNSLVFARADHSANPFGSPFTRSYAPAPYHSLIGNPIDIMLLAQLELP